MTTPGLNALAWHGARVIGGLLCLSLLACHGEATTRMPPTCRGAQRTEIRAAKVITMDPEHPVATRLWLERGRVVAVDANAGADAPSGCVKLVDLGDATVVPGIIDGHTHVRELGMDALKVDLVGAEDLAEIVARLEAAHPEPDPGVWIRGQGWDEGAFASSGYPDAAALTEAFPHNPVALESLHGFAGMYNASALEAGGIGRDTSNPEGGTILRRQDGTATGILLANAQRMVDAHVPPPTLGERKLAISAALRTMSAQGVTMVHEAGMSREDVDAFEALADEGALPIRVYGMLTGNDAGLMDEWFARGPLEHPGGMLTIRGIKVFYDGSLGSRTAVLEAPYADAPDLAEPAERISPERIEALGRRAAETGFQLATHAIGDEGNRRTLRAYAAGLAGHEELDHRWRIEHAQVVGTDFFDVAAKLGVIVSMQPSHAVGDSAWAEDRLGPERAQRAYAWRAMLDAGVPLIFNSDLPGEPWKPMETLYFAVTRQRLDGTPQGGWRVDQAVTRMEALRAMTTTSAHAAFAEDELGALRVGMAADFAVLDRDPLEVPERDIKDIVVRETWIAGQRVSPE